MSNQYLSFDVTKEHDIQQVITGRQGDSQLKQVTLALWDGNKNIPYDLTDKTIKFEGLKSDDTNVIDKAGVTILNAKAGLARYQFNPQVFALPGHLKQAFFKIEHEDKKGNKTADSTLEVDIFVLENLVEQGIASDDYLSEYDAFIAAVKKKFDDYAAAVQQNINDVKVVHDELEKLMSDVNGIALAIKRRITVTDSASINLSQTGDWGTEAVTNISGNVKISKIKHNKDNALTVVEDGLYVPEYYSVDFKQAPTYFGAIDSIQQTVSQSILMAKNTEIFNVQAKINNAPDNERHATINHLTPAGNIIDTMEIVHSGHGSGWNIIKDDSDGIEFLFIATKNSVNKIVSLKYQAGQRLDMFDKNVVLTEYPNPNNLDAFLVTDIDNNQIAAIDTDNKKVTLYKYDDFVAKGLGASEIKNFSINITTLQGAALDGDKFYIFQSTIDENDAEIIIYNLTNKTNEIIKLGRLGQDPQLSFKQSLEGEGMFTWTNPTTNEKSFFIGVATGYAGGTKRVVKLYAWHDFENKAIFDKLFIEKSQTLKLYDGDGSVLTLDVQPSKMSDINFPGIYYFNNDNFNKFTDKPVGYDLGESGFYLITYPNNKAYIFKQEIFRLNNIRPLKFSRYVDKRNNSNTDWIFNNQEVNQTLKPATTLNKLSDLSAIGDYYLNTDEWHLLTDVPKDPNLGYGTSGFFVKVGIKNSSGEFIQEAVRNTHTDDPAKIIRTVMVDGVSNWLIIK